MKSIRSTKDINNILKNIPSDTFAGKRAITCLILLSITGCTVDNLRYFNLHVIAKLSRDGKVTIKDGKSILNFRTNKLGKRLLCKNFNMVYGYYENEKLKVSDHVLMSAKGKPITNKSFFTWLYRHLSNIRKEPSVKSIFNLF